MLNTKMIGNKIAEARKKINISQAQLSQRLFISSQAVGKWERGESMPDITTFSRLAEILGVDLNYFSEHSQSETTETVIDASIVKQSDELQSSSIKEKKKIKWDLSDSNWVEADFSGLKNLHEKFSSSNMQRCFFIGSDLSGLLLKNNNVDGCDFSDSDISNSQIQKSNLHKNLFKGCSLKEAEFSTSYIMGCNFSGANLTRVNFLKNNHVDTCDFSGSDISSSYIQGSSLANTIFKDCCLKETEFSRSSVMRCDFSDANFSGLAFKSGAFGKNTIVNVIWNHTSFTAMEIEDIVFEGRLEDCYFENCTFKRVTFQNAVLTNTFFKNNNLKRVKFVDCQADQMTYEFLKSGSADLTGIKLLTP
ncbi:DNA-binding protein [Flavobacterium sp. KMS]|uniref:pentapeptide repeat-containing protein n=1 Tax=Flavobacterium sp. KMS TaxID=1566023 RepID=UPI00057EEE4B|nr:pentapeptide repeat-containing protein [Flavobacterium sp. KMS]KIA95016.1 DNA-binding protein [Flavobacterium sp. KMS]